MFFLTYYLKNSILFISYFFILSIFFISYFLFILCFFLFFFLLLLVPEILVLQIVSRSCSFCVFALYYFCRMFVA